MNHLDPRPRQRDSLADANPPDEETARFAYLQRGVGRHFAGDIVKTMTAAGYAVRENDPFTDKPSRLLQP